MFGIPKKTLLLLGATISLGVIGYNSIFWVGPGWRAIIFNKLKGVSEEIYSEGVHLKLPLLEMPIYFNITPKEEVVNVLFTTRVFYTCDL